LRRGNASLVYTNAHTGGNVNPSPRGIELGILAPFAKACANRIDGGFHADDASNLLREH
jgi:hypothetical protein